MIKRTEITSKLKLNLKGPANLEEINRHTSSKLMIFTWPLIHLSMSSRWRGGGGGGDREGRHRGGI